MYLNLGAKGAVDLYCQGPRHLPESATEPEYLSALTERSIQLDFLWAIAIGHVRGDAFQNELADKVRCGVCADIGQAVEQD